MASAVYMSARQAYGRPQAVTWADNYAIEGGLYVPVGTEYTDFIILSDHNRKEIDVDSERIENRKRMINGRMRSYYVADKKKYSLSWSVLPSRAFDSDPAFNSVGVSASPSTMHTADGGAGGWDIKRWYDTHPGDFWMLLSYDAGTQYGSVNRYTHVVNVYFSSFSHSVVSRGITDLWDISLTVEEA